MDKVILCQLSVHKAFDSPCGLLQVQAIIEDISLLILAAEGKIKCTENYKLKKNAYLFGITLTGIKWMITYTAY